MKTKSVTCYQVSIQKRAESLKGKWTEAERLRRKKVASCMQSHLVWLLGIQSIQSKAV